MVKLTRNAVQLDQHKRYNCAFTPRDHYRGSKIIEELKPYIGVELELEVLWLMDEDDPYPGEYAMGYSGRCVFGRSWLASGDLIILEEVSE